LHHRDDDDDERERESKLRFSNFDRGNGLESATATEDFSVSDAVEVFTGR